MYRVLSLSSRTAPLGKPRLSKTGSLNLVRFVAQLLTLNPLAGKTLANFSVRLRTISNVYTPHHYLNCILSI